MSFAGRFLDEMLCKLFVYTVALTRVTATVIRNGTEPGSKIK